MNLEKDWYQWVQVRSNIFENKNLANRRSELAAPLPKISYNREVQSILQYATIDGDNR